MITEEEILKRVGFINPPPEAMKNTRATIVISLPGHIEAKINEQLEKYQFHGDHGQRIASFTALCLILGCFFDDLDQNEEIIKLMANRFNFVSIEPEIKEVAEK